MGRPFWTAFAAYLLPTFPLGYIWHLKVFKKQYDALEIYRPTVIIPFGLTTMVIQGLVFAWAYPRLFAETATHWMISGIAFGAVTGVLAWSFATLPAAAKYRMTSVGRFLALETAFTAVHFLIVGPLIALAWRAAP